MIDLNLFLNPLENFYVYKKWDWDYLEAEKFQLECVDYVYKNPHISLLLICSHPHCFTIGRGLQKLKDPKAEQLIEFDKTISLPFPLHEIKRGGGLTFHYPGQFVFYPIMNLTHKKLGVHDLMLSIMETTKVLLQEQFSFEGLTIKKDLLGLWFENEFSKAKLASIGLAVSRFNTYHGLALNFFHDEAMFFTLKSLHPCGLSGDLYRDLEILLCRKLSLDERERFTNHFIERFITLVINHSMTDKQRSSSLMINSISELV